METLKKKSMKNTLVIFVILLIFGALAIGISAPSLLNMVKGPVDWEDVDFSGDIEGTYVKGTLYFIYDAYAEETKGTDVVAYEYIIDADDTYYIGLRVTKNGFEASEALLFASYDYMDGLDDGTKLQEYQYEISGTIKEMPDESLDLYHEYLGWDDMDTAAQATFLPYYIEVGSIGNQDVFTTFFFIIIGLICIIAGIYLLVSAMSGKYQKMVYQYINAASSPEAAAQKVESFLETAPNLHNLQYDQNFICGQSGAATIFGETDKLIWAYKHTVNHKRYFITVSKTHSIKLVFIDGSVQDFSVNKEVFADEILAMLNQLCPKAIIGYSDELAKLHKNNFSAFLNLRYNAPQTAATEE